MYFPYNSSYPETFEAYGSGMTKHDKRMWSHLVSTEYSPVRLLCYEITNNHNNIPLFLFPT